VSNDRVNVLLPRGGPRSIVDPTRLDGGRGAPDAKRPSGVSFDDILTGELGGGRVRISSEAQEALYMRGISLGQVELDQIGTGMEALAKKGGKTGLLLARYAALVVDVPERTVTRALSPSETKSHVFTQIDSALVLD
jgi:flagellar operon protein